MFDSHFKFAKALQNSPCNNSRKFINLMNEEVDGSCMVQEGEGSRERLGSYSLESQGKVTPGFWKPKLVTLLSAPPEGGSVRGRGGWRCCRWLLPGEAEPARSWLWPGEDYFSCHVFTPLSCVAKESRPQHCIIARFEYSFFVLTVIYGEIFTLMGYLFIYWLIFVPVAIVYWKPAKFKGRHEEGHQHVSEDSCVSISWSSPMSTPH